MLFLILLLSLTAGIGECILIGFKTVEIKD